MRTTFVRARTLTAPLALLAISAGDLFVTNTGDATIKRSTPGGVASVFASTGLNQPTFLAFHVPEPDTYALIGGGLSLLGLGQRLRRNAAGRRA